MSSRYEDLAGGIVLSSAELAVWSDGDLAAFMAANSPHCRTEHARLSPDVQHPVGDRGPGGAAGHHHP